jgi:hypothetical protein
MESIGGGKKWFEHIVSNLRQAKVVLVLLSANSQRRPWLSFEAGVGVGNESVVIPIAIRDFSLGKLDFPLLGFQGRSIDDLPSILSDITKRMNQPSEAQDLSSYVDDLREAERKHGIQEPRSSVVCGKARTSVRDPEQREHRH